MRRRFMCKQGMLEPLEKAYYPLSQASATIPIKSEYKYMDIVAIAQGGRATSYSQMSGCGSGGAFIIRKLLPTIGRISYSYANNKLSISMSTNILFELGMGDNPSGGVIPAANAIESTLNKFIDTVNGGYFNFARSGGGGYGAGGYNSTTVTVANTGGKGGSGGVLGGSGSKGDPDENGSFEGSSGGNGSASFSMVDHPFKIANIITPGTYGAGQNGGSGVKSGFFYIYGGAGGGGAGISYRGSGGKGGQAGSDLSTQQPGSGQKYGAGMSGIPYNGKTNASNYSGGDALFLVIYHNDNIPGDD